MGLLHDRRNYFFREDVIPIEVGVYLKRVLEEEANLIRNTKKLKVELRTPSYFKAYELFELLIDPGERYITGTSLRRFMRAKGHYILESGANYVLERLDKDKDGKASYVDFLESLAMFKDYISSSFEYKRDWITTIEPRSWSPQVSAEKKYEHLTKSARSEHKILRYPEEEFRPFNPQPNAPSEKIEKTEGRKEKFLIEPKEKHLDSPLKIEDREVIRKRKKEIGEKFTPVQELSSDEVKEEPVQMEPVKEEIEQSEEEKELEENKFITPRQPELKSPECPTTGETPLRSNLNNLIFPELVKARNELLVNLLKDQLFIDKFTEKKREQLYTEPDYNPKEAFKFFIDEKIDTVSLLELKHGLNKLGVYRCKEDLLMMMTRYDLNKDGMLSYQEFEAMLSPQKKIEKSFVEDKPFSESTKCSLKTLLYSIIENEVKVARIRSDIFKYAEENNLFLEHIFNDLEENKKEYLTIEDVSVIYSNR